MTVVVPTRDRPGLLSRTVAWVLAQRGVAVVVIVVDDGSSPDQARATRQVAAGCTVLRHEVARGVAAARNAGLAAATTPWVAFVDDDDLWASGKLRRQLDAVGRVPGAEWACSGAVHFSLQEGLVALQPPPPPGDVLHEVLRGNVVPGGGSGVLARTSLLRRLGGMDGSYSTLADWDCWIRLAQASPIATVREPDVGYRVHARSMAHDLSLADRELVRLLGKHEALHRRHGLEFDDARWTDYQRSLAYRSGAWTSGLRLSTRLVVRHRRWSAALQPAAALAPLDLRLLVRERRLRPVVDALPDGALHWLAPAVGPGVPAPPRPARSLECALEGVTASQAPPAP